MTRARTLSSLPLCLAIAIALVTAPGCALLRRSNESIIRIQTRQNPAEAARLTLKGVKALHHGNIEGATDKFMAAVHADSTYGPAHNNLGLLHFEEGNLYQAALAFEQAMDLMPQDPAVYYNMALTLESAGRSFEALDLYSQAVEMDPANPSFLGNLVRLRIRLGENDPTLVTQLQDLILIETRDDWRRWADRQLALNLNPTLDRGPDPPEFNARDKENQEEDAETQLRNSIIELTPIEGSATGSFKRTEVPANPGIPANPGELQPPQQDPGDAETLPIPPPESTNTGPQSIRPLINDAIIEDPINSVPIGDSSSLQQLPPTIDSDELR